MRSTSFPAHVNVTRQLPLTFTAHVRWDGKLDLALVNYNGTSILLGNGDGTFQPPLIYAAGSAATSLAAEDFNLDGKTGLGSGELWLRQYCDLDQHYTIALPSRDETEVRHMLESA
ncbi:MAG TPA: VCBS repeat-containing protein [Bryobacteraceae bacterium]|nr:VCBS repeat-containing protein [Bryobacteraceae bacterium]